MTPDTTKQIYRKVQRERLRLRDAAVTILTMIRERVLAKHNGMGGHWNDGLRQEAYRWARERGAVRLSTIQAIAHRLGWDGVANAPEHELRSVLLTSGYTKPGSELYTVRPVKRS